MSIFPPRLVLIAGVVGLGLALLFPLARVPAARHAAVPLVRGWLVLTGALVDIGGRRLRLACAGHGTPTVVLDAGLGQTLDTWGPVPDQVAGFTRVCTYTRAGLGRGANRSDPGPLPRTSEGIVEDLHALLGAARVAGPYVLVGHSFGGINAQLYAARYPDDVVGLVLVDAEHEEQTARFAALLSGQAREDYEDSVRDNGEGVDDEASEAQLRRAGPLPALPAVVLSAPYNDGIGGAPFAMAAHAWEDMQMELAGRLPGSEHVWVHGSGHFIQHDRPDLVAAAVRRVVDAARRARAA